MMNRKIERWINKAKKEKIRSTTTQKMEMKYKIKCEERKYLVEIGQH